MHYVFSYGTLSNKFKKPKVPATLNAFLKMDSYGMYPALKPSTIKEVFQGFILELNEDELEKADYYEGYPDLYDRELLEVLTDEGPLTAWVYFMNV